MAGVAVFLVVAVMMVGILLLRLHTLPERIAHKGHKLQFEIVAVLGLLALFTHVHLFWVAGLLLALIDMPDFSGTLGRIAGSLETIAKTRPGESSAIRVPDGIVTGIRPDGSAADTPDGIVVATPADGAAPAPSHAGPRSDERKEPIHA
jgi:hypothetical protein